MPYDNPILKELGGYFKAEEPGLRERAGAWATAIGLQKRAASPRRARQGRALGSVVPTDKNIERNMT